MHQQQNTDCFKGQFYSNIFQARYSRASHTSSSEAGRPSTTAPKEAKMVRSDARHSSPFYTTQRQYCSKMHQRNMLKALARSTWGCEKETLITTYQAIGDSIFSYCCSVWTPSHRDTYWCRLQRLRRKIRR